MKLSSSNVKKFIFSQKKAFRVPELCENINNNISFLFRLFPRKTNDKIFQKIQKNPILGPFWAVFAQMWAKMHFLGKKLCHFLDIQIIYHRAKIQKYLLSHFWEKCWADRRTDIDRKRWFYRTLCRTGVQLVDASCF